MNFLGGQLLKIICLEGVICGPDVLFVKFSRGTGKSCSPAEAWLHPVHLSHCKSACLN